MVTLPIGDYTCSYFYVLDGPLFWTDSIVGSEGLTTSGARCTRGQVLVQLQSKHQCVKFWV
jgi:hypothetical protein